MSWEALGEVVNAPITVSKWVDTDALHPTRRQVTASPTSDDPDERAFAYDIVPICADCHRKLHPRQR